jgi:hypothetical protein
VHRCRFFGIARFRFTKGKGKDGEDFDDWGVIAATKERGKIEARFG